MEDSKQLTFEGFEETEAAPARRITRRAAARRLKPERVVIASQAVDVAGLYRDIEAAADKAAADRYGVHGVCLGVQMVFPGWEWVVDGYEVHIGHREDPTRSETIIVAVNTAPGNGKSRRNRQERLAA